MRDRVEQSNRAGRAGHILSKVACLPTDTQGETAFGTNTGTMAAVC